jgi:hypothetical protein
MPIDSWKLSNECFLCLKQEESKSVDPPSYCLRAILSLPKLLTYPIIYKDFKNYMNALIIPVPVAENLSGVTEFSSLADEEQQLAHQEQLMLDREIYYQDSPY